MTQEFSQCVYGYSHVLPHQCDSPHLFVETNSSSANARLLSLALLTSLPIIVQGPRGCGKTFLIHHFAQVFGQAKFLVELHISDQTDCKALLGSYVCSDVPGEFKWRNGLITDAVINGHWVVIDNIDSAPLEFVASLATLLVDRKLQLPDRTNVVAHHSFRLFGTRSTDIVELCAETLCATNLRSFSHLWQFITVKENTIDECEAILKSLFPCLLPVIVSKIMLIYSSMNELQNLRKFRLREIVQVCSRLDNQRMCFNSVSGVLTEIQKELSFIETVEVFALSIRNKEIFNSTVRFLAEVWEIPNAESCLTKSVLFVWDDFVVSIGRVKLSRYNGIAPHYSSPQHYLRLMEKIGNCVCQNESVLLVGETGSGKTTTVQQLAKLIGQKLIVLNLSLSTDVADLVGGYQPVSLKSLFLKSFNVFLGLFAETFVESENSDFIGKVHSYYDNENWKLLLKAFHKASVAALNKLKQCHGREIIVEKWEKLCSLSHSYSSHLHKLQSGFAFSYVEGLLLTAMRNGHWVLLDEINLASSETLQSLGAVLDPKVIFRDESEGKKYE